jgi:hypothetical protein
VLLVIYRKQQEGNCKVAYFYYSKQVDENYVINKVVAGIKKMAEITAILIALIYSINA